ncbi:MAG: hypothetical protein NW224_13270 [Leptolyngbyaceae cyanobacterium bins.302]|nr:hypothetical protein [Leptolyngbyaceae cyanobacterium bins.302]
MAKPMVKHDRSFALRLFHPNGCMTAAILLAGSLAGCAQSQADQAAVRTFNQAVVQHIQKHSEFGYSEAEIYLTVLSSLSDEAVYEFGDRTCEMFRRGSSRKQIADTIQSQFSRADERGTYMHIAQTAQEKLCPESI